MHRNKSKFAAIALVAAVGLLGMPALAKSTNGKGRHLASLSACGLKTERERAPDAGPVRRAPTFGAPNPNRPSLTGGDSTGYNANLYVY